jgi:hypothetical protein
MTTMRRFFAPLLPLLLVVGCAGPMASVPTASPPAAPAGQRLLIRKYGALLSYDRARVAIASLPTYTVSTAGGGYTLTATANAALTSTNYDGVTPAVGDQVLLIGGAAGADNQLYTLTSVGSGSSAWTMAQSTSFQSGLVNSGIVIDIDGVGTTYGGSSFRLITSGPITVGITNLTWVQLPWRVGSSGILPNASTVTIHEAVAVCTSNISTLSGLSTTCDGVSLAAAGQRVLLAGQSTSSQNGLYLVQSSAWLRPADWYAGDAFPSGSVFEIASGGTAWGSSTWKVQGSGTIGSTSVVLWPRIVQATGTLSSGSITLSSLWIASPSSPAIPRYNGAFSNPGSLRVSSESSGSGSGSITVTSSSGTDASPVGVTIENW